jgi:GTP cyclohydrolase IA
MTAYRDFPNPPPSTTDTFHLEHIGRQLLVALGEDPDREGLRDTPRRFAQMWREFIDYDPGRLDTAFESIQADQLVIVGPMRVWSKCEHHTVDFWCDVHVGYIPGSQVLGLSKFARIAHYRAHRLQLQERLVSEIAKDVQDAANTPDVAVLARGEHLCMTARGIRTPALVTSSSLNGAFRQDADLRREFLSLATGR